ncbi:prothoracicotropic hormone-like isoform X2 [Danaus plexippus]|uniref:Prothoracicotropic hormone n=1 Tax=Danaus plexippus plexippus TaxID=278856 RepID=A0A212EVA1_DANPL|nr:prothoracicotropic hormone-like isoform X2 [Danaus plexippus]OWR45416.1 prothoracicotropic hormone [Danaus plexippus plexippus]
MRKISIIYLQISVAAVITVQLLVPIIAFKKTSNVDQFMVENQRTRMRQNYIMQRALDSDNDDKFDVTYVKAPLVNNNNPEELPALIVDYANMIRNDIILLDNSVETRTRKRGNIKVEKYDQRSARDIPCSCELESREPIILGEDYIPRSLESRNCNIRLCPSFYACQQRSYNITVLKRRRHNDKSVEELPDELKSRWVAVKKPVTIGCVCIRDNVDFD